MIGPGRCPNGATPRVLGGIPCKPLGPSGVRDPGQPPPSVHRRSEPFGWVIPEPGDKSDCFHWRGRVVAKGGASIRIAVTQCKQRALPCQPTFGPIPGFRGSPLGTASATSASTSELLDLTAVARRLFTTVLVLGFFIAVFACAFLAMAMLDSHSASAAGLRSPVESVVAATTGGSVSSATSKAPSSASMHPSSASMHSSATSIASDASNAAATASGASAKSSSANNAPTGISSTDTASGTPGAPDDGAAAPVIGNSPANSNASSNAASSNAPSGLASATYGVSNQLDQPNAAPMIRDETGRLQGASGFVFTATGALAAPLSSLGARSASLLGGISAATLLRPVRIPGLALARSLDSPVMAVPPSKPAAARAQAAQAPEVVPEAQPSSTTASSAPAPAATPPVVTDAQSGAYEPGALLPQVTYGGFEAAAGLPAVSSQPGLLPELFSGDRVHASLREAPANPTPSPVPLPGGPLGGHVPVTAGGSETPSPGHGLVWAVTALLVVVALGARRRLPRRPSLRPDSVFLSLLEAPG